MWQCSSAQHATAFFMSDNVVTVILINPGAEKHSNDSYVLYDDEGRCFLHHRLSGRLDEKYNFTGHFTNA